MAVPIAVGELAGRPTLGLTVAFGALVLGAGGATPDAGAAPPSDRDRNLSLVYLLLAVTAAMFVGLAASGETVLGSVLLVTAVTCAALVGGISRAMVRATSQFITFSVIASNLGGHNVSPGLIVLVFVAGAVWGLGLVIALRRAFHAIGVVSTEAKPAAAVAAAGAANNLASKKPTVGQLFRRWRGTLAHLAGWQYALRLGPCVALAETLRHFLPDRHAYWVTLTVALVVHRNLSEALTRTLQRAGGTLAGIGAAAALLMWAPPAWALIVMIGVLAGARPVLRVANYAAYSMVMTPLVMILLDLGQPPSWALLGERLAWTLVGCALSLSVGYGAWARLLRARES
jgi:hypothetical protein